MTEAPSIQWFPGHMAKTRRLIRENLKLVDLVVEMADARIPLSSRNPELAELIQKKPRIILLNKSDLADERLNRVWCQYFATQGLCAISVDCLSGKGLQRFEPAARKALASVTSLRAKKGMSATPLRIMVLGIPNVGKSSLINRLAGSSPTRVEDRPGVTRGRQWVSLKNGMDLLDMPGVLWPKFQDSSVGERLAFTGAVKDDILDTELLASRLLRLLCQNYPAFLLGRYNLNDEDVRSLDDFGLLALIARKRGMFLPGGELNTNRAAAAVLDDFRGGKIGRITLERPPGANFANEVRQDG